MKHLIVIAGPTAVGKTETAIQLAQLFNTEIVSSDSRQVFIETKIGTAAPTNEDLRRAKHHLIGVRHVWEDYNAWKFEQDALSIINEIHNNHDFAILVGGSGLYIDAVCRGIDLIPDIQEDIRLRVNQLFENEGIESLRLLVKRLDPTYYETVDIQNPARLKRAIEISLQTGVPYSQFRTQTQKERPFAIIKIALNVPREELYERINKRVDTMIDNGLEDEVRSLLPYRNCTSLNTVGYREMFNYFDGTYNREEAIEKIKQNTRKYAKKQITWLKRTNDYTWVTPYEIEKILSVINDL